jgi:hypothetical protein
MRDPEPSPRGIVALVVVLFVLNALLVFDTLASGGERVQLVLGEISALFTPDRAIAQEAPDRT